MGCGPRYIPRTMPRLKTSVVVPRRAGDRAAELERGALETLGMRYGLLDDDAAWPTSAGRGFLPDRGDAMGGVVVGTPAGSCSVSLSQRAVGLGGVGMRC